MFTQCGKGIYGSGSRSPFLFWRILEVNQLSILLSCKQYFLVSRPAQQKTITALTDLLPLHTYIINEDYRCTYRDEKVTEGSVPYSSVCQLFPGMDVLLPYLSVSQYCRALCHAPFLCICFLPPTFFTLFSSLYFPRCFILLLVLIFLFCLAAALFSFLFCSKCCL